MIKDKQQDWMQQDNSIGHFDFMVWDAAFYLVKLISLLNNIHIHIITLHARKKYVVILRMV